MLIKIKKACNNIFDLWFFINKKLVSFSIKVLLTGFDFSRTSAEFSESEFDFPVTLGCCLEGKLEKLFLFYSPLTIWQLVSDARFHERKPFKCKVEDSLV